MTVLTSSRLLRFLAAAAMLAAICPATARADGQAQFQRNQAFTKRYWEHSLAEMPLFDAAHPSRPLADVMSLTVVDGQLTVRTALPSTPVGRPTKVKLGASTDWAQISIANGAAGDAPVIPTGFFLQRNRFDPEQTDMLLVQQIKASVFIITRQVITPTGRQSLTVQEQFANGNQHDNCSLTIMDQAFTGALRATPLTWNSDNFSAFEREHPLEADGYLRPLLHDLGQDSALAPDPMLTFQVFSDQWTPDPAITAKVSALVANLGGGDFHSRNRAEKDLTALGKDAAIVLLRLDRGKLGPEQNARIDKIVAPYCPASTQQAQRLRTDPVFLLDCLYSKDLIIRKLALTRLESVTKLKLKFDPTAGAPTRTAAIPPLLEQLIAAKIIVPKP